jgi:hypothetical protein
LSNAFHARAPATLAVSVVCSFLCVRCELCVGFHTCTPTLEVLAEFGGVLVRDLTLGSLLSLSLSLSAERTDGVGCPSEQTQQPGKLTAGHLLAGAAQNIPCSSPHEEEVLSLRHDLRQQCSSKENTRTLKISSRRNSHICALFVHSYLIT